MRSIYAFAAVLFLVLPAGYVHAQESYDSKHVGTYDFYKTRPITGAPSGNPGMQTITIGGMDLMVPQGMRVYKMDGTVVTEGLDSYTARRFDELEARLDKLAEALNELAKETAKSINELKKELDELKAMSQKESAK
ncbi:MAG: hypothetical protein WC317_04795 [Candidatus Omnitrophota bacterium]|jgi:hypothetical protein